jgi:pimeloyl-ACP methyl ester carboxylesterase
MSNSRKAIRVARGISQSVCIALLLWTCCAHSTQNQKHRVRNIVLVHGAWRRKPSWMLVATKDRAINPDLERWYATRAKSHKVEVSGASHAVYVSRPKEVAALIEEAASHAY